MRSVPELDEWSKLYQAAIRVKEIAPWEWMSETEIFGVQNPETGEIVFVSVMGMLGEHYSVAVYLGSKGLYGFWGFQRRGPYSTGEELLEIPHLQASFENRNELTQKDRDVIKQLGLKFRGRQAWPMFRSYRPGYFPWYLEAHEARVLTHALQQTADVAPRVREDPTLLETGDDESYLVRAPREEGTTPAWEERVVTVPPPEPSTISIPMDVDVLDALMDLPPSRVSLEMDLFVFPARIGERGARPYYTYMLMVVDGGSGMLLGSELLRPDPTTEAMYGMVPVTLVHLLARINIVPTEVRVRSGLLFQLMELLAEDLGFKVVYSEETPALDQAKEFLTQRFI